MDDRVRVLALLTADSPHDSCEEPWREMNESPSRSDSSEEVPVSRSEHLACQQASSRCYLRILEIRRATGYARPRIKLACVAGGFLGYT